MLVYMTMVLLKRKTFILNDIYCWSIICVVMNPLRKRETLKLKYNVCDVNMSKEHLYLSLIKRNEHTRSHIDD